MPVEVYALMQPNLLLAMIYQKKGSEASEGEREIMRDMGMTKTLRGKKKRKSLVLHNCQFVQLTFCGKSA